MCLILNFHLANCHWLLFGYVSLDDWPVAGSKIVGGTDREEKCEKLRVSTFYVFNHGIS